MMLSRILHDVMIIDAHNASAVAARDNLCE